MIDEPAVVCNTRLGAMASIGLLLASFGGAVRATRGRRGPVGQGPAKLQAAKRKRRNDVASASRKRNR